MAAPTRILVVCSGNTCRSPMAAALLRAHLADRGLAHVFEVTSAGTSTAGEAPASPHALTVMGERGIDLTTHRTRKLTPQIATAADHVLAMRQVHYEAACAMGAKGVQLFGGDHEFDDPYGQDEATYRRCADALDSAAGRIAAALLRRTIGEPDLLRTVALAAGTKGLLVRVSRPGHSNKNDAPVPEAVARAWAAGLIATLDAELGKAARPRHVRYVCLLGWKDKARTDDEIRKFYRARRPDDTAEPALPLLVVYLGALTDGALTFAVDHVPMVDDGLPPSPAELSDAAEAVMKALARDELVLLGCSAACGRTGAVLDELQSRGAIAPWRVDARR